MTYTYPLRVNFRERGFVCRIFVVQEHYLDRQYIVLGARGSKSHGRKGAAIKVTVMAQGEFLQINLAVRHLPGGERQVYAMTYFRHLDLTFIMPMAS